MNRTELRTTRPTDGPTDRQHVLWVGSFNLLLDISSAAPSHPAPLFPFLVSRLFLLFVLPVPSPLQRAQVRSGQAPWTVMWCLLESPLSPNILNLNADHQSYGCPPPFKEKPYLKAQPNNEVAIIFWGLVFLHSFTDDLK